MYCRQCGKEIPAGAKFCTSCGAPQDSGTTINGRKYEDCSPKSRGLALILACLGCLIISGIHRFYVGKIGTGILWLLTGGLFGIGTIIDIIMIACGSFEDSDGKPLTNWNIDE